MAAETNQSTQIESFPTGTRVSIAAVARSIASDGFPAYVGTVVQHPASRSMIAVEHAGGVRFYAPERLTVIA